MVFTFKDPTVLVQNIKAAFRAACPDFTRAHMHCIRIELDGKRHRARFVATNGHWLWVNEIEVHQIVGITEKGVELFGEDFAVVHLMYSDVKKILKGIDTSKKARSWSVDLDPDAHTFDQRGAVAPFSAYPEDARFPPYEQVIPDSSVLTADKRVVMSYALEYIAQVASAFDDIIGDAKNGAPLTFETGVGDTEPVAVSSNKAPYALAILMPRREDTNYAKSLCDIYKRGPEKATKAA